MSRDCPAHVIKCLFFCNYSSSLHRKFKEDPSFRDQWTSIYGSETPEPNPDAFFYLVLPKMHARNLALLQRDVSDKYNFSTVGMHEDVLWTIAGQVSSLYRSLLPGVFFCRILSRPRSCLAAAPRHRFFEQARIRPSGHQARKHRP